MVNLMLILGKFDSNTFDGDQIGGNWFGPSGLFRPKFAP